MVKTACTLEPTLYHCEPYLRAAAMVESGGELCVWRHGEAVIPLIVRPLPEGCGPGFDAISPYDFSGPLLNGACAAEVWRLLRAWAEEEGIIAAFFRFHPLRGSARSWMGLDGLDVIPCGDHVLIELADRETMLSTFKRTVQRDLKVAYRHGVSCDLGPANRDGLEAFARLYEGTMERVDASDYYRFPRRFFHRLAEGLGDRLLLATAWMGGRTVASSLTLLDTDVAYYFLTGFDYDARPARPMNMLVFETACRLYERGLQCYYLGGGSASLRDFKERFGPGRTAYFIGQAVFDRERYAELAGAQPTSFFPAYRAAVRGG